MSTVALRRAWAADLDTATLYQLLQLRVQVFVVEQRCAEPELDGLDLLPQTRHLWLDDEGEVIGTMRLLEEHSNGVTTYRISRLCTAAAVRGKDYGERLLQAALADTGDVEVRLDAQRHLVRWYAGYGFVTDGEPFMDGEVEHVPMRRGGSGTAG